MEAPRLADLQAGPWVEHTRFKGIHMQGLLTAQDNPLASVNAVRVPPGGVIGRHQHPAQAETVYVLTGQATLTLDQTDVPIRDGHVIAIPIGLEHALRNDGTTLVELLTFFTPPLP
jgi:quercetin dioxygenase-like cupin family protein